MKLRPYTPAETNELISKFSLIADYQYAISEKVHLLILSKYYDYIDNFKISLFTWKPCDFEKFCKHLSWSGVRFIDFNHNYPSLFDKTFFNKPFKVFRHTFHSKIFDTIFTSYGVPGFTESELDMLNEAAILTDYFIFNYELHTKYSTLINYASKPFEFDESDIKWLEQIDLLYNRAIKWNSN